MYLVELGLYGSRYLRKDLGSNTASSKMNRREYSNPSLSKRHRMYDDVQSDGADRAFQPPADLAHDDIAGPESLGAKPGRRGIRLWTITNVNYID